MKELSRTLTRFMFLNQTMYSLCELVERSKGCWMIIKELSRSSTRLMFLDYQGTLENVDKVDILQPNNAFILRTRAKVKKMLDEYQKALEDLHFANSWRYQKTIG